MILRAPFVGVLAWLWLALMNPHRETYGFLHDAPLNLIVAALTGLAWLASRARKTVPLNLLTVLLFAFLGWATLSTFFALDRLHALPIWSRTVKTFILAFAVVMLVDTRMRLQAAVWTIAVSLGYFAVLGGGFTVLSGGRYRVFGPEASMIEDNNALGLALVILLPLFNYLRVTSARRLIRAGLWAAIGLDLIAILGTYSRGALIALAVAALVYALRSRAGVLVLVASAVAALALPSLLPAGWVERMSSIQSADQDASFQQRLEAWTTAINIAKAHPMFGGGFVALEQAWVAQAYSSTGSLKMGRAAHSIYFQVLGDTGFVGLALYLSMMGAAVTNTFLVLGTARGRPDLDWAGQLARMLQVSIGAFVVGGAALSMAYYDGMIVVFALTAALLQVARQPSSTGQAAYQPPWKASRAAPASLN